MDQKDYIGREIRQALSLPRKHAGFFNWHKKDVKEKSICNILLDYLEKNTEQKFELIESGENPPDCVVHSNGQEIAVEVVELVDQESIEAQVKCNLAYPPSDPWTSKRLTEKINSLVSKKDTSRKSDYLKDKFQKYILLIHIDEPELSIVEFDPLFKDGKIIDTGLITEIYAVFSYDPRIKTYPIRQLK